MVIQFWNNKILFVDGKIAMHEDCCCEDDPSCPTHDCLCIWEALYIHDDGEGNEGWATVGNPSGTPNCRSCASVVFGWQGPFVDGMGRTVEVLVYHCNQICSPADGDCLAPTCSPDCPEGICLENVELTCP